MAAEPILFAMTFPALTKWSPELLLAIWSAGILEISTESGYQRRNASIDAERP